MLAISGHCARGEAARPLVRHGGGLGRDGDAGRQTLEVDGEIDAGQRLVEIVDVEQDVVFGRIERAEVHQMTVAAGLHRGSGERLMRKIGRHHRRRAAKKPERVRHHALVALRHERGDPLCVGLGKYGDRVPIQGAVATPHAPRAGSAFAALCLACIAPRGSSKLQPWLDNLGKRARSGANSRGRTGRRQSRWTSDITPPTAESPSLPARSRRVWTSSAGRPKSSPRRKSGSMLFDVYGLA